MMMVELNSSPVEDLPMEAFASHLRLAEGFGELPGQAQKLEWCLRAAIAALEARLGKLFLERDFIVRTNKWSANDKLTFSSAPVKSIDLVKIVRSGAEETVINPDRYTLQQDAHRPALVSRTSALPMLGVDASAEVTVRAGYSGTWDAVPAALRQATFILAETFFDREPGEERSHELPCAVCLLVEPFRDIRLRGSHC